MKKMKILTLGLALSAVMTAPILLSACDFSVNYQAASDKLNEAVALLDEESKYTEGKVLISGEVISLSKIPAVSANFINNASYDEVNKNYNTIFSYTVEYIKTNAKILATPPTVEALTEKQENLYKTLEEKIETFKNECKDFNKEIENVNKYFENMTAYGSSKSEAFVLNYKKAYRDFVYDCFDLANAIEDVMASVYQEIDYEEYADREGEVFKSFEDGINIRIFEGYFSLLVDTFDCRFPTENIDANNHMRKILATYKTAKANMIDFYKSVVKDNKVEMSKEEIQSVQETINVYFEETAMFQHSYDKIEFAKFYFDNDCDLEKYIENNYANKHYYDKICEYIDYTLPKLTNYVSQTFSA